jgi:hypothetical protein
MVTSAKQKNPPKKILFTHFALIFLCCCSVKIQPKKTMASNTVFRVFEITKTGGSLIGISAIKYPREHQC